MADGLTVADLIEKLQTFPKDAPVFTAEDMGEMPLKSEDVIFEERSRTVMIW